MSIKGFSINGQVQKYDYNALDNIPPSTGGGGITNEVKQALLQIAQKVAYIDANGQTYYQALYNALNAASRVLTSITAVFNQGSTVIYTTDTLNDLKPMLTVTANYSDSTTATVTDYTLSGNLTAGTSVISVLYSGQTTTFNVTVTPVAGMYTVVNNLTGCTTSNSATTIAEETAYNATITASAGYSLNNATVSVTMGGTDVTNTAYSGGTISIANVTGNIVITVTATAKTVSSITAVFSQGANKIYVSDTLDVLRQYLVVTANYSDSTSATVSDYMLSGTLAEGTSVITVSYGGKTTTFSVTVSDAASDWEDGVAYVYELVPNEYITGTGAIATYNGWSRTPYLPCKNAASIRVTSTNSTLGSTAYYSHFFNENYEPVGEAISLHNVSSNTKLITVPTGGCYFGASKETSYMEALTFVPNA